MTLYVGSPAAENVPVPMLIPGQVAYAFGSRNANKPTVKMTVQQTEGNGTTATLNVTVVEGFIPAVGDLISVIGTTQDSGAFNATNAALTNVSINATTGIGTVQYASGGSASQAADPGLAYVTTAEVPEAISGAEKSQQFAIQNTIGRGYGITWAYLVNTVSAISIQLEGAVNDNDAEYTAIGDAVTGVSGWNEVIAQVPNLINFVRIHVVSESTSGTIIAKLLLS
jgi:hypothetical protein